MTSYDIFDRVVDDVDVNDDDVGVVFDTMTTTTTTTSNPVFEQQQQRSTSSDSSSSSSSSSDPKKETAAASEAAAVVHNDVEGGGTKSLTNLRDCCDRLRNGGKNSGSAWAAAAMTRKDFFDAEIVYIMSHYDYIGYAKSETPSVIIEKLRVQFPHDYSEKRLFRRLVVGTSLGRFVCRSEMKPGATPASLIVPAERLREQYAAAGGDKGVVDNSSSSGGGGLYFGLNVNMLSINFVENALFCDYTSKINPMYTHLIKYWLRKQERQQQKQQQEAAAAAQKQCRLSCSVVKLRRVREEK